MFSNAIKTIKLPTNIEKFSLLNSNFCAYIKNDVIVLYDLLSNIKAHNINVGSVIDYVISPDIKFLAEVKESGSCLLVKSLIEPEAISIKRDNTRFLALHFSNDSKKLYFLCEQNDKKEIRELDLQTFKSQLLTKVDYSTISFKPHPNNRIFGIVEKYKYTCQLKLWDRQTKKFYNLGERITKECNCFNNFLASSMKIIGFSATQIFIKTTNQYDSYFISKRLDKTEKDIKFKIDYDDIFFLNQEKMLVTYKKNELRYYNFIANADFILATKHLKIPYISLLKVADQVAIAAVKKYPVTDKPNIKAIAGEEWLKTAGLLSNQIYGKKGEKGKNVWKEDRLYAGTILVGKNNPTPVDLIIANNGGCIVEFPGGGAYTDIARHLNKVQLLQDKDEKTRELNNFLAICSLQFNKIIPNTNNSHANIAKALLDRIAGSDYPNNFPNGLKIYLDTLLALIVGVEGSRNNATFLIVIMILDLIAANRYGFDQLFVNAFGYSWNDKDKKIEQGGKFSMAVKGTGPGNLVDKRKLLYDTDSIKAMQEIEHLSLRHHVIKHEMKTVRNWVDLLPNKEKNKLLNSNKKEIFFERLRNIFNSRLKQAYSIIKRTIYSKPFTLNKFKQGYRPQIQQKPINHYLAGKWCYYLPNHLKPNNYYHRADLPCKSLSKPNVTISLFQQKVTHIVKQIDDLKKGRKMISGGNYELILNYPNIWIQNKVYKISPKQPEKYWNVFCDFQKWRLSYCEWVSFNNMNKFRQEIMNIFDKYEIDNTLKKRLCQNIIYVLPKIMWQKTQHNNQAKVNVENIIPFYLLNLIQNSQIRCNIITEIIELIRNKLHVMRPDKIFRSLIIKNLFAKYNIVSGRCAAPIFDAFLNFPSTPTFRVDFRPVINNITLQPCPYCFHADRETALILPYAHNKLPCAINSQSNKYHRIGSQCASENGDQIVFVGQAKDMERTPCPECWWDKKSNKKKRKRDFDEKTPPTKRRKKP